MIAKLSTYLPRLAALFIQNVVWRTETNAIHLTFDDGPSALSERLLDRLESHGARATFFMLGESALRRGVIVRESIRRGHVVAAHGMRHLDAWRATAATVRRDFADGCAALEDVSGIDIRLLRPPYGRLRPSLIRWAHETRRQVVMWDVMPGDFLGSATSAGVASFVLRHARPGSIVVLHDNPHSAPCTPDALDHLLPVLAARRVLMAPLVGSAQSGTTAS